MAICSWQTFQCASSTASNKAFQAQSKPPVLRVVMILKICTEVLVIFRMNSSDDINIKGVKVAYVNSDNFSDNEISSFREKYHIVTVPGFIEVIGLFIIVDKLNIMDMLAKVLIGVIVIILNYIFSKTFVFNNN